MSSQAPLDVRGLLTGDRRRLLQRLVMAIAFDPPPTSLLAARHAPVLPRPIIAPVPASPAPRTEEP